MVEIYKDDKKPENDYFIRTFKQTCSEYDLVWHRDKKDRDIIVLEGEGWSLQKEDEDPIELVKENLYQIKAYQFHRLLKGTTDLKLKIWEKEND